MLALRFSIAFLAMNVLVCARVVKVDLKKDLRPLLALGLFQPVLYFTFESLGIKPVSYTHLDVYKRQMLNCSGILQIYWSGKLSKAAYQAVFIGKIIKTRSLCLYKYYIL